ncbi:MAG: DUF4476 domain-containing protein, partial [Vicingaceae bacterium]|nr:DUF4476 domain-containing protein [Vicingaceae bacterium]
MKNVSLLIVLLLSLVKVNAYRSYATVSDFNLKLWNNTSFKIFVDNYEYGKDNFFSIQNIQPGIHQIKVVKHQRNPHGYGMLTRVMYNGAVSIPVNSKVLATVTSNRKLQLKITRKEPKRHINHHHGNNGGEYSNGYNNHGPHQSCAGYGNIMSHGSFNKLIITLDRENFDTHKLKIAKQALAFNNLTTNQVILLLNQFTFDSNKLKLAKIAFTKTIDQENYFLV